MQNLVRLLAMVVILMGAGTPVPLAGVTGGCNPAVCDYDAGCAESAEACFGIIVCSSTVDGCEFCDWEPKCVNSSSCASGERIICEISET